MNAEKYTVEATPEGGVKVATPSNMLAGNFFHIKEDGSIYKSVNNIEYEFSMAMNAYLPKEYDDSSIPRLEPVKPTFNGTTHTVGVGGDFATLTAAYNGASAGDILSLLQDFDLTIEPGGYWLINSAKRVKVDGNGHTLSAMTGTQAAGVRIRNTLGLLFENVTIKSNLSTVVNIDAGSYISSNIEIWKDNVNLENNNSTGTTINVSSYLGSKVDLFVINSTLRQIGEGWAFRPDNVYSTYLYNTKLISTNPIAQEVFEGYRVQSPDNLYMYKCSLEQTSSSKILSLGNDTSPPPQDNIAADIRDCEIKYLGNEAGHGVLLGRGTDGITFINNTIKLPSINNTLAIGLVIKTIATGAAAIIKGNNISAPRPFYIKGGSNIDAQYNYIKQNYKIEFGVEIVNQHEDVDLNADNIIFKNNFIRAINPTMIFNSNTSQTIADTISTWDFDNNTYFSETGNYLNQSGVLYPFNTRDAFWTQDANSVWKNFLIVE